MNTNEKLRKILMDDMFDYCHRGSLAKAKETYAKMDSVLSFGPDYPRRINFLLRFTCYSGHFEVIRWLWKIHMDNHYLIDINYGRDKLFKTACKSGNVKIVEWLYYTAKQTCQPIDIHSDRESALKNSLISTKTDVIIFLLDLPENDDLPIDIHISKEFVFRKVCVQGHFELAKKLVEIAKTPKFGEREINIYAKNNYAFRLAAVNGYLDIAIWLRAYGGDDESLEKSKNYFAFRFASANGFVHVLKWLWDLPGIQNSGRDTKIWLLQWSFTAARKKNQVDTMEWLAKILVRNDALPDNFERKKNKWFRQACLQSWINYDEHIKVARFLYHFSVLYAETPIDLRKNQQLLGNVNSKVENMINCLIAISDK